MPSALNSRQCWHLRGSLVLPLLLISFPIFARRSSPAMPIASRNMRSHSRYSAVLHPLIRTLIPLCACKPTGCASAWPSITEAKAPDTRCKSPFNRAIRSGFPESPASRNRRVCSAPQNHHRKDPYSKPVCVAGFCGHRSLRHGRISIRSSSRETGTSSAIDSHPTADSDCRAT